MEFELIIKKLDNTLSQSETEVFNEWVHKKAEHQSYFNNVKENYNNNIDHVDLEKGWKNILAKIDAPKQGRSYWKYAVAASVILVVGLSVFLQNRFSKQDFIGPVVVETMIESGSDKAILTLEDGSEVALEKGSSYQSHNVTSNGEEIVYDKPASKTAEIAYNYLTIPRGGQFNIVLADGTEVWLNSESQLKYPVSFTDGITREVELVYGEAYFDVSPSTDHKGARFKVLNKYQEIEVLGTEFNIKAYKDEVNIYTTLVEGKVAVGFDGQHKNLVPNQQAILNSETNGLTIAVVDVYNEISWKEGVFSFEEKSLKQIMKVLSRWYDMEVVFLNKNIEDELFVGVLGKEQNIEDILTSIKRFEIINDFEINGKTVSIK